MWSGASVFCGWLFREASNTTMYFSQVQSSPMIIIVQKEVTDWSSFKTSTSWTKLTLELTGTYPAVGNPIGKKKILLLTSLWIYINWVKRVIINNKQTKHQKEFFFLNSSIKNKVLLTCWYVKCVWPQFAVTVGSLYLILKVEIRLKWQRSCICVTIPQWC